MMRDLMYSPVILSSYIWCDLLSSALGEQKSPVMLSRSEASPVQE
jgi:hypothetical protein